MTTHVTTTGTISVTQTNAFQPVWAHNLLILNTTVKTTLEVH